ncbi:MAG TPA: sensor histidine kinase [Candidatus Brocadiia bacterium]|nr:sensor histidine kinase [Candidatus Brocadiales bacterium]
MNIFTLAIVGLGFYALHVSPYTEIRLIIDNNAWVVNHKDCNSPSAATNISVGDKLVKIGNIFVDKDDFMRFPEFFLKRSERTWWNKQKAFYETLRNNDTVSIEINRDGNTQTFVTINIRKNMPLSQIVKRTILIYVSSLLSMVIGILSFLRRPTSLLNVLCAFFSGFGSLYLASVAPIASRDLVLSPLLFHILLIGTFIGAGGLITLVHFSLVFPKQKSFILSHPKGIYFLYIYSLLVLFLYLSGICAFGMFFPFLSIWTMIMICAFFHAWVKEQDPFLKQQISLSLIAPVIGGVVFVFANLLPAFIGLPTLDFNYFALITLILPFTLSFAIENYHLYKEKNKNDLENQRERTRIMEELHDNLGNDLINIKMFSEVITKYLPEDIEKAREYVTLIKDASKSSMEQLRDFLRAIDTKYATWDDLINQFKEYGSMLLQARDVNFVFHTLNSEATHMTSSVRFNLYRIYKEALGNILKHAEAKNVQITISLSTNEIEMKVEDDGKGFITEEVSGNECHGIKNMQKRTKEMDGTFTLYSAEGKGTQVYIRIPIG